MPLIQSPRHSKADLIAWEEVSRYDRLLARGLAHKTMQARQAVRDFANKGPCYVSTSWGKDSTALAHIVATSGCHLPLVWVRVKKWENPDCLLVRDEFLRRFGDCVDYEEIEVEATAMRWWDEGAETESSSKRTSRGGFKIAEEAHGGRHISGIRAEESRVRTIAQKRWGAASSKACRPLGWWKATDVFAYLDKYDLPIHPAYAMSYGGRIDRRWLRVSSLGGIRGADQGRAEWEAHYYPDVVGNG